MFYCWSLLLVLKVILHQFWVKKFSPENSIWNTAVPSLSYSCMFQVEICSQQLEICKSVCMFIILAIALWRLINFRLFCSDDYRSWPREKKINNHGCWCKHAHIPDNDYWGICLFHVVWTIFFLQLFLCGTHGIYFILNLPRKSSNIGSPVYHLHYCPPEIQNYLLSNILAICS